MSTDNDSDSKASVVQPFRLVRLHLIWLQHLAIAAAHTDVLLPNRALAGAARCLLARLIVDTELRVSRPRELPQLEQRNEGGGCGCAWPRERLIDVDRRLVVDAAECLSLLNSSPCTSATRDRLESAKNQLAKRGKRQGIEDSRRVAEVQTVPRHAGLALPTVLMKEARVLR
jgi:hypothetical protein